MLDYVFLGSSKPVSSSRESRHKSSYYHQLRHKVLQAKLQNHRWPSLAWSQFPEFKVQGEIFRLQCRNPYTVSQALIHLPWQGGFSEGACPQSELVELWSQLLNLLCQLRLHRTIGQDVITGLVCDIKRKNNSVEWRRWEPLGQIIFILQNTNWQCDALSFFHTPLMKLASLYPPCGNHMNIQLWKFIKNKMNAHSQPHYFCIIKKEHFKKSEWLLLDLCNLLFLG